MAISQKTLEMRGMRRIDLIDYFISLKGVNTGFGKIRGENWEVEVSEESLVTIGSFSIPSTILVFRCEEEFLEPMISAFRLKFLSAGG